MRVSNDINSDGQLREKIKLFYLGSKELVDKHICPTRDLLVPLTDKWSLFCLFNLGYHGVLRFNELQKYIPNISSRMLSVTLKKLEQKKLIIRTIYPEVPPRVEYKLTAFGEKLADKMVELNNWLLEENRNILLKG